MLKRKEFILGAAAGLAFAAAATAGGIIDWPEAGAQAQRAELHGGQVTRASTAGVATAMFQPPPGAPNSFADIIEQVSPAVVQIDVRTRVPRPAMRGFNIPGLPFPFPMPQQPEGEEGEEPGMMEGAGSGSGFFISADGYIVTNNHVVANASEITVRLTDERELRAEIVGRDELTDLAVLKVEGTSFPFVQFETQAQPRVGDWVVALGNPFGLGGSATAGIVSARGRDIGDQYVDFIQIDAPINRGNSGGPTFDIYGRVIGVNTAIFSPTGVSVGIGFAIPADVAHRVTQQLMQGGSIERGYLGVQIDNLRDTYREALGLGSDVQGAYVVEVTPGGPAERGGVRVGDVIVQLNGERVRNNTDLTRRVGQARPGETLRLTIIREGRETQLNVRSGTRPSQAELNAEDGGSSGPSAPQPETPAGQEIEGLTVTPLTAALRSRHSIPDNVNGLVITGAGADIPAAARRFLQPGVVIMQADGRPVASVADFRQAVDRVRQSGRPGILLLVRMPQGNVPVVLELDGGE